jgi:hypothetical protein
MRLFWLFVVGTVGFVLISYFEQVPVLGWLGAVVSVGGWVMMGRELARDGSSATITSGILGAWTGFVGALTAWIFQTGNLFGLSTPGLDRVGAGFGFVGASLGLLYWPLIGAAICAGAAFLSLGRRLA